MLEPRHQSQLEQRTAAELKRLPDQSAPAGMVTGVLAHLHLEQKTHFELRQLSNLRAPESLLIQVLNLVAARQGQPWWQNPFFLWPAGARISAVVVATALMAGVIYGGSVIQSGPWFGQVVKGVQSGVGSIAWLWEVAATLLKAASVVANQSQQLLLWGTLGFFAVYLWCLGLGAACFKLVLGNKKP
jgi:hypothetical protein